MSGEQKRCGQIRETKIDDPGRKQLFSRQLFWKQKALFLKANYVPGQY